MLERVYEKTGIPVLLNTSFNLQEPIVETPQEALKTFAKFGLDYFVLHNYLVKRKLLLNWGQKSTNKVVGCTFQC